MSRCHDCRVDTCPTDPTGRAEYYMVHDDLWQSAITSGVLPGFDPPPIRYLCVGCLEGRIGRRLAAADFPPYPVNDLAITDDRKAWSWRTPRLQNRLHP